MYVVVLRPRPTLPGIDALAVFELFQDRLNETAAGSVYYTRPLIVSFKLYTVRTCTSIALLRPLQKSSLILLLHYYLLRGRFIGACCFRIVSVSLRVCPRISRGLSVPEHAIFESQLEREIVSSVKSLVLWRNDITIRNCDVFVGENIGY